VGVVDWAAVTLRLDATDDVDVEELDPVVDAVVEALLEGDVVLLPTDTIYGIAAIPTDPAATAALFDLKGRAADAPLAVLCADVRQAGALVAPEDEAAVRAAGDRWWPGPLTLVCRRRAGADLHLGDPPGTVGLRVPDHPLVRMVAARVGPIATTSANRHGEPAAITVDEALDALGPGVAVAVDGGTIEGRASTVVDTTTSPWRVLREGPIPADEVVGGAPTLL
jgi:tRNA threonylcarbamoyl adenosine modification protein (Sua5/YciO/YrdC/YwlC family)